MTGITARPSCDAETTYEAFAPFYDDFTAHYDYELWLGSIMAQLERCGLTGNRLLDVGCGTGKSFIPMLERGWKVTACDISTSMVALARAKIRAAVRLEVADMRVLPTFGQFDLVWALDDAVNYLLSVEELEQALTGMHANLAPGGLLVFDLNTLSSYRTFFAQTEERVLADGRRIVWQGLASPDVEPGSICEAAYAVGEDGAEDPGSPVHRQRHFPPEEVEDAMSAVGLQLQAVFGHGFDTVLEQPLDEDRHSKMVFVARHERRAR